MIRDAFRAWRWRERRISYDEMTARSAESVAAFCGLCVGWGFGRGDSAAWFALVWLLLAGRAMRYFLRSLVSRRRDGRAERATGWYP